MNNKQKREPENLSNTEYLICNKKLRQKTE